MHHIIARGIERCKIFRDDVDCNNFLDRLGRIIDDTGTVCFAHKNIGRRCLDQNVTTYLPLSSHIGLLSKATDDAKLYSLFKM